MTPDPTGKTDYYQHYGKVIGPILTRIRDAATELSATYGKPLTLVQANAQSAEGVVLSGSFVYLTREAPENASWHVSLGFQNFQDLNDHIGWDVPDGHAPSIQVPIEVRWYGKTRRGVRESVSLEFPSIEVAKTNILWGGKGWSLESTELAKAVAKAVFERVLIHATPWAAEEARHAIGRRWQKKLPRLAAAGQGEVWEVIDMRDPTGPTRALKELRWTTSRTSTAYKRFQREILITSELARRHQGIIEVIDYFIPEEGQGGEPYYVMPMAKTTLAKARHLKGKLEAVLEVGLQVADALATAHSEDVIHRDVKPANILLLSHELRPVVADFGICFLRTDEEGRLTKIDANTVGPDDYAAPELSGARPDDVDGRVDVYSLGKVLYFVLSGGELFPRERWHDPRFDLRRKSDDPRLNHFYGLIERMVVEYPEGRFRDMVECRDAIARALSNVQKNAPYLPGAYGGPDSPFDRFERVRKALATGKGPERTDAIREEVTRSLDALATIAGSNAEPSPASGDANVLSNDARRGGEQLLSVGLPLVLADDSDGLQRWLDRVLAEMFDPDRVRMNRSAHVGEAAAVSAFYGAAALAWHRERFSLLRAILARYEKSPTRFNQLGGIGLGLDRSWKWVVETLSTSEILRHADGSLAPKVNEALTTVSGVALLRYLLAQTPERLATIAVPGSDMNMESYPAMLPVNAQWPAVFGKALRTDGTKERSVALILFGIPAENLRDRACESTALVARILAKAGREYDKDVAWRLDVDPQGEWKKWCGGVA